MKKRPLETLEPSKELGNSRLRAGSGSYVTECMHKTTFDEDVEKATDLPTLEYYAYHAVGLKDENFIGDGFHAQVYRHQYPTELAAIKIFRETDYEAQIKEARIHHVTQHPNIVKFIGFMIIGQDTMLQYGLAMEYCGMGSLSQFIIDNPVENSQLLRTQFSLDTIRGLAYLHNKRIIHGDIHPGNVYLRSDPCDTTKIIAKIGDFGLSHYLGDHEDKVYDLPIVHVQYAPPEVFSDDKPFVTFASDIFSLGHLLHMMTQDNPINPLPGFLYDSDNLGASLKCYIYAGNVESMQLEKTHSSVEMQALILSCFKTNHTERPTVDILNKKMNEKTFSVFNKKD